MQANIYIVKEKSNTANSFQKKINYPVCQDAFVTVENSKTSGHSLE